MTPFSAFALGVVEGLTEYLPVSSTGHLIVTEELMGQRAGSFDVVIQLGAVLAVAVHYRALLFERVRGLFRGDKDAVRLFLALGAAFVPTAAAGFLLRPIIKCNLFGTLPVGVAFIVGGLLMIAVEVTRRRRGVVGVTGLTHVTVWRGFLIGIGQCFSLFPGASRSMCTIVTGQLTGLSTTTAAEFSFLLALPTLGAATVYEGYKGRAELAQVGAVNVAIGLLVSFFVAWAVIATFLGYLKRRGLEPFGYYRIVAGAVLIALVYAGKFPEKPRPEECSPAAAAAPSRE